MARPSSPSVKLTAFEEPTNINIANGMKNQPKLIIKFLKKGNINFISWFSKNKLKIISLFKAISIWEINLNLKEIPDEFLYFTFL